MKRYLFWVVIFLTSINLFSQTTISGLVKDDKGEPLPGANIYIEGTYDGVSSDADGKFSFKTTEKGEPVLKIEYVGFDSFSKEINLDNGNIELEIILKETFNLLNAVTITAGTFEASDKKKSVVLTPIDMVTTAGTRGDIYGVLETLPGTTTNGESGKLFVKGGHSNESKTFIDGTLVYVPYNSTAPNTSTRGRFNPFMFDGTIFSSGGYSAEYGQALSSVLILNTTTLPVEDQLHISLMSIGGEIAGTKVWKNGGITGSFGYNNLEPYMSVVPQNYEWNKSPESMDGAINIQQKTGKTGKFKLYSSMNKSKFSLKRLDFNKMNEMMNYDLTNDNFFVNASWKSFLSKNWSLKTGASFTNNIDDVFFNNNHYTESLKGSHIKSVFLHEMNKKVFVKFGAEFFNKYYKNDYTTLTDTFLNNYTNNTLAGFIEADIYSSLKFVTRIGGRVEYSDYLNEINFAPRISTAYKLNKNSQISFSYGWFYQYPSDYYLLYTNEIKYERADHYIFSFQSRKNKRTLRTEVYYKDYKNLIKLNGGEFYLPNTYSNNGKGYAYGLDIFWRDKKTFTNGEYWISYSYLNTKRNYLDFPVEAVPKFASKHNLSVVYKYWFGSLRTYMGSTFKYSSPRYFNDPNSYEFNKSRTTAYYSLDLSITYLHRENIIFFVAVSNVLGFKQEFGYQYAKNPNDYGIYESSAIIPSSKRFFILACFITLSRKGDINQLNKIK